MMEVAAFLTAYFTLDPRLKAVYRCFCLWANNRRVSRYAVCILLRFCCVVCSIPDEFLFLLLFAATSHPGGFLLKRSL